MADALAYYGRRRERLAGAWAGATGLLLIMLIAACGLLTIRRAPRIDVGSAADFPPGSVTVVELDVVFRDPAPPSIGRPGFSPPIRPSLPIWLAHDPQAGLIAFIGRDPRNGCQLSYQPSESHFIDPCHGAHYSRTGAYIRGPAVRDLDRLGVTITRGGRVLIDPQAVELGAPIQQIKPDL